MFEWISLVMQLTMSEVVATVTIGLLKLTVYVYDFITLPFYTLVQLPFQSVNQDAHHEAFIKPVSEGICYSSKKPPFPFQVEMKRLNVDTLAKAHKYAFSQYPNRKALGTRQVLSEFNETQASGKVFKKNDLGEYKWQTFSEVDKTSSALGRGMRELGIQPKQNVMVLSETRAEWFMTLAAAFKHNIPICTLYATLGYDGLIHGINETETEVLVTSHDMMPKVKNILESCKLLKTIIYFPDQIHKTSTEGFGDINVHSYKSVLELGAKSNIEECLPTADDIAVIMYTSGSTGVPKGVVLSHRNLMTAVIFYMGAIIPIPNELFMAYLPLAHVLEIMAENLVFTMGITMGYSSPLTMTDRSTKVMRGCKGDISMLQPTFITAVPLVLDRIYKGILEKVSNQSVFLQSLFKYGIAYKMKWSNWGYNTPICDWFVFRKVRALFGGNLRMIATGGAPLAGETHSFIRAALGIPVIQGYGLTETCGCSNVMLQTSKATGQVGPPVMGSDVKLINWEEGSYFINDKPNPRGEIVIGGDHVAVGYYKNDKKTKEEFIEIDGRRWFKTGDIGTYLPDASLKIIDRKKDLVKLQIGEYVSLAKVENALSCSPLVENICVYGESNKNNIVAIVTPVAIGLTEMATSLNKPEMEFEELCNDQDINQLFLKTLIQNGQKAKLERFELPTALYLSPEQWTPDTGLVTAAFKLKRVEIKRHYQEAINRMYGA